MSALHQTAVVVGLGVGAGALAAACIAGPPCSGACLPAPPSDFSEPMLVWIGKESDAPDCEKMGLYRALEGGADLKEAAQCPACGCAPWPCQIATRGWVSRNADCASNDKPDPMAWGFDMPDGWDGRCTPPKSVQSDVGHSFAFTTETPLACQIRSPPGASEAAWGTHMRACAAMKLATCSDDHARCLQSSHGNLYCIRYEGAGQAVCPSTYPDKRVFFTRLDGCTPCDCNEVEPRQCSINVSYFGDAKCTQLLASATVTAEQSLTVQPEQCVNATTPGSLQAVTSTMLSSKDARCEPVGGEQSGKLVPADPVTLCCAPPG